MDNSAVTQFLSDIEDWGKALYHTQGWKLPYWEQDDWSQYALEWGLRILKYYGPELTEKHAFALTKTALMRDCCDITHSVRPCTDLASLAASGREPWEHNDHWLACLPAEAVQFVLALWQLPSTTWIRAEGQWKAMGRKKLSTSVAGISFLLGWPQNRVKQSIVILKDHLS